MIIGTLLVGIGLILLLNNLGFMVVRFDVVWPLVVIGLGFGCIEISRRVRSRFGRLSRFWRG